MYLAPNLMVGINHVLNFRPKRHRHEALRVVDEFVEDVIWSRRELDDATKIKEERCDLLLSMFHGSCRWVGI